MSTVDPAILCSGPLSRLRELERRLSKAGIPSQVVAPPGAKPNS